MEAQESKTVVERALVSYSGTATGNGGAGGNTVVCSALTALPDYAGLTIIITEGAYAGQSRDINGSTTGGTINVEPDFGGQIVSGINFSILTGMPAYSELVDIMGAGFDTSTDSLVKLHDDHLTYLEPKVMGRAQVFEKSITVPANTGDVVVATITDQPCLIESVIIHADTVQPAHMTNCGVFGGAAKVITFIAAADALQADLDSIDKQVYWEGKVRLAATKTIVIALVGSGADNVDLTIIVKYRACTTGGYLV